jgi:hypothetical protein
MSVPETSDLVTALQGVTGVAAAEILRGSESGIGGGPDGTLDAGMLRLTLLPGADEVSVATEVNQILREQFGLGLDAGRVQVVEDPVQVRADPASRRLSSVPQRDGRHRRKPTHFTTEVPVVAQGGRLLIQRMQVVSAGMGITTAVTLSLGGESFVGEADGGATPSSMYRTVAEATLGAIECVVSGRARLSLDAVDVVKLGEDEVALVAVSLTSMLGTERLVGSSAVREDVRQAVIRATLDSLNRRLESVLAG